MERIFLEKLDRLHEESRYQEIIDLLEEYETHDYDTIGHLARAYNNRGQEGDYDKALQLLMMAEDLGREDALWHYRTGYAYFYSGRLAEAEAAFEQALMLDPGDEEAEEFLRMCRMMMQGENGGEESCVAAEVYDEEELDEIEYFISDAFGEYDNVFHEIVSPDIHVDICIIPPDGERDFYTLVTMGMGAHRMNVPEELEDCRLSRAELAICLPGNWDVYSDKERWYWPIRLLKVLARLPLQEDTWLGWGHSIDNGRPFDESTELCGCMLIHPAAFSNEDYICPLPDGSEVNFYQVIPLYREEMEFKMEHSAEDLLKQLDVRVLIVNPDRQKFCAEKLLS